MFNDIWTDLEMTAARQVGPGIIKRMVGREAVCSMFIGIRIPGLLRTFILQVPHESAPLPDVIPESRGFSFTVQIVGDEVLPDHVSLIISSSVEGYNEIFASIAEDIYLRVITLRKRSEVVTGFLNRVRLWQLFFEKMTDEGLSEEAQRGLYGELYFLSNQILPMAPNAEKAVLAWTGPKSRQNDFQFGSVSVEVKTTASKQHQKLQIASEQQLDESAVQKLYLYYLSVSLVESGMGTLPTLVDVVRNKISSSGRALSEFNSLLIEAGYLDVQRSRYENTGYSIRESGFFLVENDFPRIRESDIRSGVGDVQYTISVAQCRNYQISEAEFSEMLRKFWI